MNTDDFNPRHHIQVFDAFGTPIVPAPRYSSAEQQLRAENEAQALVIAEFVRCLRKLTEPMWANVDSDEVMIHIVNASTDGLVGGLYDTTANAYRQAVELIKKHGGTK